MNDKIRPLKVLKANKLNAAYYQKHSSFQKAAADTMLSQYIFNGDENVLDIGCGDGYITAKIAQQSPKGQITGIDPSASMIHFASQNYPKTEYPNLNFQTGAAEDKHGQGTYDLITAFNCLHWIADLPAAFASIYTALKPKGRFLGITYPLNSPYWQGFINILKRPKWQHLYHNSACTYWFTTSEYKKIIEQTGFQLIYFDEIKNHADYERREALANYVKGWLPCLASFSSDTEQNDFLNDVIDYVWTQNTHENGACAIPFVKLELVLSK